MNKKLLIGVSSAALALGFWACGSGTVEPMDMNTDDYVKAMLESNSIDFNTQVADAKKSCKEDPVCENEMAKAQGSAIEIESSETLNPESSSSDPGQKQSSSSRDFFDNFSSSGPIGGYSSSSSAIPVPQSSSSEPLPPGTFGTCGPATATVDQGKPVTWNFEWAEPKPAANVMLGATFAWTFEGGSPAVGEKRSASTTYAEWGPKTASVTVTAGGATQTATCSVNVNGAPITGCQCVGTNTQPDVAAGESATWKAVGCTSTGAEITGYTWTVATASADGLTAAAPVTKKGDVVTGVSFTVANNQSTLVTIPCEDAKAIDATLPDYVLEFEGSNIPSANDVSVPIPFNQEACIKVTFDWQNSWTPNNISVLCDVSPAQGSPGLKLDISYNGASKSYTGDYNISNSGIALGAVKGGTNVMDNVCVTVTGVDGGAAKCFFGN